MQKIPKISLSESEKPTISNASEKTEGRVTYDITEYSDPSSTETALGWCVDLLEELGGDLDVFCKNFKTPATITVFHVEHRLNMLKSPLLKERWEAAIELFHSTRMKLLRRQAIKKLEELDAGEDKAARVELSFAKLVLGDLLAASTAFSRKEALNKKDKSSGLESIIEEVEGDDA